MFRNLFRSRRSSPSSSGSSVRLKVETLEDRTAPAATPVFSPVSGVPILAIAPNLAGANALLNNQIAGEFATLAGSNPSATTQNLSSRLGTLFLFTSAAPMPNASGNALQLISQEAALSTDLALLVINPGLGNDPQFIATVNGLAAAIHGNPQFLNFFGSDLAFTVGALVLNQELSALVGGGAGFSPLGLSGSPFGFGGSPFGATSLTPLNFGTSSFGFTGSPFGFATINGFGTTTGLATSPFGFGTTAGLTTLAAPFGFTEGQTGFNTPASFTVAPFGFSTGPTSIPQISFGLGSVPTTASSIPPLSSQQVAFGFGQTPSTFSTVPAGFSPTNFGSSAATVPVTTFI